MMTNWVHELKCWIDHHEGLYVSVSGTGDDCTPLDVSTAVVATEEIEGELNELKKRVDKYETMLADFENYYPKEYNSIEAKWEKETPQLNLSNLEK